MSIQEQFYHQLTQGSDEEKAVAWQSFCFDLGKVRGLDGFMDVGKANLKLVAGAAYGGAGWTTANASKTLYNLTGLCVHAKDFQEYKRVWLLTLALYLGTDLPDAPESH